MKYKVVYSRYIHEFEKTLNQLSDEGWRVISIVSLEGNLVATLEKEGEHGSA